MHVCFNVFMCVHVKISKSVCFNESCENKLGCSRFCKTKALHLIVSIGTIFGIAWIFVSKNEMHFSANSKLYNIIFMYHVGVFNIFTTAYMTFL